MGKDNSLFSFLIEDIKGDFKTLKKMIHGEAKFAFNGEEFKAHFVDAIKGNWLWFFLIILAVLTGWFYASQYYAGQCDIIINELYGQNREFYYNVTKFMI